MTILDTLTPYIGLSYVLRHPTCTIYHLEMVQKAFELFLIFPFSGTPTLVPGPHSGHQFHPFWSRIPSLCFI